jgi:hypothetical protein
VGYFTEGRKCTRFICLEKVVKISSASSVSSADDLNVNQDNDSDADDIADGMQTILNLADDTFNADDKQTIEKKSIVCAKTSQLQGIHHFTDDANDKNTLVSKTSLENFKQTAILKVGDRVKPKDIYHVHGSDVGTVSSFDDWAVSVAWDDKSNGKYSADS